MKLNNDNTGHIISVILEYFTRWGVAKEITLDGAKALTSGVMQEFLTRWGLVHSVSSAYYPCANKRVELAVKSSKRLLMDNLRAPGNIGHRPFRPHPTGTPKHG
jgi:hypothetical protein